MTTRMSASMTRDQARRATYAAYEETRQGLLALYHDRHISPATRQRVLEALQELDRSTSLTRVTRRCVVTGRGRGVLRRYRMSRLVLRRAFVQGRIPGVFKASW
jgi:small subunit ribosomal protein S14